MQIKVGIADDHQFMIDSIREILIEDPDVEVTVEVANGDDLVRHPLVSQIQILFLDIRMPGLSGLPLIQELRTSYPRLKIIVLSMFHDLALFRHMWHLGVMGFMSKSASSNSDIQQSMQMVREGKTYLDRSYQQMSAKAFLAIDRHGPSYELSERQLQLMALFAQGMEADEVGEQLHISKSTVFYERNKVIEALGVSTFIEAVSYCVKQGLLDGR